MKNSHYKILQIHYILWSFSVMTLAKLCKQVDEGSRLKIALQLTLHPFNDMRDLMLAKSLEHKQDFIKGNDSELN